MTVLVVTSTTLAAATLFVAMRLVSRVGIVKHTTWDDYVIVLGWALAFACSFATAYATGKGLGMVDADIKVEWKGSLIRCEYVLSVLYVRISRHFLVGGGLDGHAEGRGELGLTISRIRRLRPSSPVF